MKKISKTITRSYYRIEDEYSKLKSPQLRYYYRNKEKINKRHKEYIRRRKESG